MSKKTIVFGASPNAERYSNRAVIALQKHGHEVVAIGARAGEIDGAIIQTDRPDIEKTDTITLYLGADRQRDEYEYLLGLAPQRIIFNPGAENPELAKMARERGIEAVEGCTLVMLSIGNY